MESLPVREGEAYEKAKRRGSGLSVREDSGNLREQVVHNLPTPRESMHKNQGGNDRGIGTSDDYNLETVAGRIATLPTPMTDSGRQSGECRDFGGDLLHGVTCENCKVVTLPTPTARDHKDTTVRMEPHRPNDTDTINRAVASLMPTPTVMDMGNKKTPAEWTAWKDQQRAKHNNGNGHGESLTQAAIAWGKYEPAIRRWEALTREVPEPTVPHKEKRRLNPAFVEWMMGLPAGHVTGHGLSAAKELKMLGNGVVPQQARSAVTQLMERITQ
jgi:DNA (cytosine-5)-methyltransferase 1